MVNLAFSPLYVALLAFFTTSKPKKRYIFYSGKYVFKKKHKFRALNKINLEFVINLNRTFYSFQNVVLLYNYTEMFIQ